MRVLLVTSQCTYVKDNYYSLLKKLADKHVLKDKDLICGVVFIRTASFSLFLKAMFLMLIGVRSLSLTLIRNMISSLLFDRRKRLFRSMDVPVFLINNINDKEAVEVIKDLEPDVIINLRTRNIYKEEILSVPKIGCINVHHGILPENRGTMCDLWAWSEGRPVGFSIHWMNQKIDDGHILEKKEINVSGVRKYTDIPMISSTFEADCLIECLEKLKREGWFKSMDNKSGSIRFTKNPTTTEIRNMRKNGLKF